MMDSVILAANGVTAAGVLVILRQLWNFRRVVLGITATINAQNEAIAILSERIRVLEEPPFRRASH